MSFTWVKFVPPGTDPETGRRDDYSPEEKLRLLQPAIALVESGVKPVTIWAEHALAFAHHIPTVTFDLNLLVPDDLMHQSANTLKRTFGCLEEGELTEFERCQPYGEDFKIGPPPPEWYSNEVYNTPPICLKLSDSYKQNAVPYSHGFISQGIRLFPYSAFHFDSYSKRSIMRHPSLPLPEGIVFPTIAGIFDSIIDVLVDDPKNGYVQHHLGSQLRCFDNYLQQYYAKEIVNDEHGFLSSLREENAAWMQSYLDKVMDRKVATTWAERWGRRQHIQTQLKGQQFRSFHSRIPQPPSTHLPGNIHSATASSLPLPASRPLSASLALLPILRHARRVGR